MSSLIIDKATLEQKIIRLAFEIAENNDNKKEICLVGIQSGGYQLAHLIHKQLIKIIDNPISVHEIHIDKKQAHKKQAELSSKIDYFKQKNIVLVDDVANSGSTLFYAQGPFMQTQLASFAIAVLVDRKHKRFPVMCNYVGTSLATTIKEHIEVVFKDNHVEAAYLE